ncbi:hypothetical protein H072_3917 [Dactylellina haptotyla CBS 200.50]|uniref:Uncharacterized protein n=1 Tax=Dactylellina haptotyla (strain CBS 200.50) TaxID=1284197 RepID=S8AGP4_DACHA|nr:hypothetical protein H072_3917 [Dactylellina haptotyla CBS 200.50]
MPSYMAGFSETENNLLVVGSNTQGIQDPESGRTQIPLSTSQENSNTGNNIPLANLEISGATNLQNSDRQLATQAQVAISEPGIYNRGSTDTSNLTSSGSISELTAGSSNSESSSSDASSGAISSGRSSSSESDSHPPPYTNTSEELPPYILTEEQFAAE